mmetsp:Transcript_9697/g.23854  ORF Transcript_9697/g.23854 Transcript_9697/m.23854 type:complete len:91 (-) Transcript_9697:430-702(-)
MVHYRFIKSSKNISKKMKLFNRWSFSDIKISEFPFKPFINVSKKYGNISAHSSIDFNKKPFGKARCPIVERFVCSLMFFKKTSGKKIKIV